MKQVQIRLPLCVYVGKKKIILNLNTYRNMHYRSLSASKVAYKELIWRDIPNVKLKPPVSLEYVYYHGNKRAVDVSNPCSIIDKYACDAIVEKGLVKDDNCSFVSSVQYKWGGVDKNNPRCELTIRELND